MRLGQQLKAMHRFTALCIGDWLAYGDFEYKDTQWRKQMPNGVYEQVAKVMGCGEGWLRNLKSVCLRIPPSIRSDKLTAAHLIEIAHRVDKGQYEFWIDKATKEGLSVKALRESLKRSLARVRTEPADTGMRSFLEEARQFTRSFLSQCDSWSPRYDREVAEALRPVLEHLASR